MCPSVTLMCATAVMYFCIFVEHTGCTTQVALRDSHKVRLHGAKMVEISLLFFSVSFCVFLLNIRNPTR